MTFLFFVLFCMCMSVSGTLYARQQYGFSLFAMFWAGYNFSVFANILFKAAS